MLRDLGIADGDPGGREKLVELERRAVGWDAARRLQQTFLTEAPDGFRGRVSLLLAPSGSSYAIVSDGDHFAVLPAMQRAVALNGKVAIVARDASGRTTVRTAPDRTRGS